MNDMVVGAGGADTRPSGGRVVPILTVTVAGALQLLVLVPFTVASGLLAPPWAVAMLYVLWIAASAVLVVAARRRPLVTPVVPVINAGLLLAVVTVGEQLLGWSG